MCVPQASVDADMSQGMNNNGPISHDFVPHIARISKLLKTKVRYCHITTLPGYLNC